MNYKRADTRILSALMTTLLLAGIKHGVRKKSKKAASDQATTTASQASSTAAKAQDMMDINSDQGTARRCPASATRTRRRLSRAGLTPRIRPVQKKIIPRPACTTRFPA